MMYSTHKTASTKKRHQIGENRERERESEREREREEGRYKEWGRAGGETSQEGKMQRNREGERAE